MLSGKSCVLGCQPGETALQASSVPVERILSIVQCFMKQAQLCLPNIEQLLQRALARPMRVSNTSRQPTDLHLPGRNRGVETLDPGLNFLDPWTRRDWRDRSKL